MKTVREAHYSRSCCSVPPYFMVEYHFTICYNKGKTPIFDGGQEAGYER